MSDCTIVYNTDVLMKNIYKTLIRDATNAFGEVPTWLSSRAAICKSITDFRSFNWPTWSSHSNPYLFKWDYQLQNLFKRYRFQNDLYDDEALKEITVGKFVNTQIRISRVKSLTSSSYVVCQEARRLLRKTLGRLDMEDLYFHMKPGKRAAYGLKKTESYLDKRFTPPFSSSADHARVFDTILTGDKLLARITGTPVYDVVNCVKLSTVPKSYKALRTIEPNTITGSCITAAIGVLIQDRLLKGADLNLSTLPARHKRLAKQNSYTRNCVTADLSSASDSFTSELLNRLLPREWYRLVMCGRIPYTRIGDRVIYKRSVMTMGIGYTFPLQTLLFWSLLKSVQKLTGIPGVISVFGDDLIYPRLMHKYVANLFENLNFQLNTDKTYVREYFRESCGGDYSRGIDVRPFQLEGEYRLLSKRRYQQFVHEVYNGLILRWDPCEIRETLDYLLSELSKFGKMYQVPADFPSSAGIRVDAPIEDPKWRPVKRMHIYTDKLGGYIDSYRFDYLGRDYRLVRVENQDIYFWNHLRVKAQLKLDTLPFILDDKIDTVDLLWKSYYLDFKGVKRVKRQILRDGSVVKRLYPYLPDKKGLYRVLRQTSTTMCWTEGAKLA